MGNRNYPKIDSRDMELFQRINKHGFVDMYYIYRFYKTDCKPRTVTDRINQLIYHRYLFEKKTFIPPEYSSTNMKAYKIIGLGVMAQRLLDGAGVIVHDYNSILKNASPYRMYHQVQLTTVCDTIQLVTCLMQLCCLGKKMDLQDVLLFLWNLKEVTQVWSVFLIR